jgi:hypothetical protein
MIFKNFLGFCAVAPKLNDFSSNKFYRRLCMHHDYLFREYIRLKFAGKVHIVSFQKPTHSAKNSIFRIWTVADGCFSLHHVQVLQAAQGVQIPQGNTTTMLSSANTQSGRESASEHYCVFNVFLLSTILASPFRHRSIPCPHDSRRCGDKSV